MDPVIGSILAEQAKWLVWRCQRIAMKLVVDWKSLDAVTAELNQAVLDRFVRRAHEGWFAEVPTVSREAQVRNLLGFCLRQEEKARFAQLKKDRRTTSVQHDAEEDAYLDVVDSLPDPTVESAPDALQKQEHLQALLRAIPRILHPVHKLVVVSLFRPTDLQSDNISAAARHSAGGKRFLRREPAEAWQLFEQSRVDPNAENATWWKRRLAEIFRFSIPLGDPDPDQVQLAVTALDQQLTRAKRDLRALLREDGIEVD